jgi:neuropeptide Y receptor
MGLDAGICKKLRMRMRPGASSANQTTCTRPGGQDRDNKRVRRTNLLLISIAIIFGISWIPLNVLNVVADLDYPFKGNKERFLILYGLCHLAGMSSACTNPCLYGELWI